MGSVSGFSEPRTFMEGLESRLLCDGGTSSVVPARAAAEHPISILAKRSRVRSYLGVFNGTGGMVRHPASAASMAITSRTSRGTLQGTLTLEGVQYALSCRTTDGVHFTFSLSGANTATGKGTIVAGGREFIAQPFSFSGSRVSRAFDVTYAHANPTFQTWAKTVGATSNIFGSGYAAPVYADGVLPASISFAAAGGQVLTFPSVTGIVSVDPAYGTTGPDGYGSPRQLDFASHGGLSGIVARDRAFCMVGVFVTDAAPNTAPARIDFTGNADFSSLSPAIGQLFMIGDGRTSTGLLQQFVSPPTATRLYLGFSDTYFADNTGSIAANVSIETIA